MSKRMLEVYRACGEADNPRDWDNLGIIVAWHDRYNIGDGKEHNITNDPDVILEYFSQFFDEDELDRMGYIEGYRNQLDPGRILAKMIKNFPGIILPVHIYDHSVIAISTGEFSDPWDSGQIGYIYVTNEKLKKEFGDYYNISDNKKYLENEIETYNQYFQGDVYAFIVYELKKCSKCGHVEKEIIDSCAGFYSTDWENNGMTDYIEDEELVKQLLHGDIEIKY